FGEAGEAVITSAIDLLFPLRALAEMYLEPFTPKGFVQLVLVPELAVMLISEDLTLGLDDAYEVMKKSSNYGYARFP
ncbi:hypothetical protein C8Q77DRAFT_1022389, partial [Trametes polyzona]